MITRDVLLSSTFVHVFGEAVEDPSRGCSVEELHGATEDLVEELVVQLGGGSQSSLHTDNQTDINHSDQEIKTVKLFSLRSC